MSDTATIILAEPVFGWRFDTSQTQLPEIFYQRTTPQAVSNPSVLLYNHGLASELGLHADATNHPNAVQMLSGNILPEGSTALAQAYAGHQFGNFTILGDGRAVLLGEHITPSNTRVDVQLKGAGQTAFSRRGDGRASLGPMLREYILSEAMHALNIPTTRSLSVVATGDMVLRETPLHGAILTRIASSHIRVGTFEYAAATGDVSALTALADYTINRHDVALRIHANPYEAWLYSVINRQAELIAQWMSVGFIHGVMNTDNMSIAGETIDYGPCAFIDAYDASAVFSAIDRNGRYAFGNQPRMAQWNLARFAEAILPLLHPEQPRAIDIAEAAIDSFSDSFTNAWYAHMRLKLGLSNAEKEDGELIASLLNILQQHTLDYTQFFRALNTDSLADSYNEPSLLDWHKRWYARTIRQENPEATQAIMATHNPAIIARNHLVEHAIRRAEDHADISYANALVAALATPFLPSTSHPEFMLPPTPSERVYQTFCGT